jgi:hypothetical protein
MRAIAHSVRNHVELISHKCTFDEKTTDARGWRLDRMPGGKSAWNPCFGAIVLSGARAYL